MRRKFGILFLVGITVLAGTREAAQQFDCLKSSLKNFTRASLWSGLIVYAQPVSDGKLPTPQIYYLMPSPQQQRPAAPAAQQQPVLADNGNSGATAAAKPEALNNHGAEAAAASNTEAEVLAATREVEDAAKAELGLNKLPLNLIASHFVAPKDAPKPDRARVSETDRVRVYEEVARHEPLAARKFKQNPDAVAKMFVREFDAAKLAAEAERLVAEHGRAAETARVAERDHLERLKLKSFTEAANMHRRMEFRVVRPAPRPERHERIRVINPAAGTRGIALPDMSSIGCEKTIVAPKAVPAVPAAPVAKASAWVSDAQASGFDAPHATGGNSWTLNCDTEPEQK